MCNEMIKKIKTVKMCLWRRMLIISWTEKKTDTEVFRSADYSQNCKEKTKNVGTFLKKRPSTENSFD